MAYYQPCQIFNHQGGLKLINESSGKLDYPLVMTNRTMENHHFFREFSH